MSICNLKTLIISVAENINFTIIDSEYNSTNCVLTSKHFKSTQKPITIILL